MLATSLRTMGGAVHCTHPPYMNYRFISLVKFPSTVGAMLRLFVAVLLVAVHIIH